jgi:hypothetical protein
MTKPTPATAQDVSERLTDKERKCLEAVRREPEAREALRSLAQKARLREEWMCMPFIEAAWASGQSAKLKRSENDSTPEEVLRLAASVRKVADKILRLNSEKFWEAWRPASDLWSTMTEQQLESVGFKALPRLLESYAHNMCIKAQRALRRDRLYRNPGSQRRGEREETGSIFFGTKEVPGSIIRGLPQCCIGSPQDRAEKALLETVQRLTGRKHRDQCAAILRAIYPLFGLKAKAEGESLRKREQRERPRA